MANTTSALLPATEALLKEFGERLRLARMRRRLQAKEVAERAGMTEVTLRRVERGLPGVSMGAYLAVMQVLQLQGDVAKWTTDDPQGRHLQDTELQNVKRPRRIVLKVKPGEFVISPGKVKLRVQKTVLSKQSIRAVKNERIQQPEEAARSISATDLLSAIRLPSIKKPGKKKT